MGNPEEIEGNGAFSTSFDLFPAPEACDFTDFVEVSSRQTFPALEYWVGRGLMHIFIGIQMQGTSHEGMDAPGPSGLELLLDWIDQAKLAPEAVRKPIFLYFPIRMCYLPSRKQVSSSFWPQTQ